MKRLLWMMTAICMGLASCSDNNGPNVEVEDQREITFSVMSWADSADRTTRSHFIRYYDEMMAEQIDVTAVMPDNSYLPYINQETLAYSETNDAWHTAGRYYWPMQPLNFFALLPKSDSNRGTVTYTAEATSFTYTSPQANSLQSDLMYACVYNQTKSEANGNVSFYFLHPLAAISFKAKTENSSISVDVSSIELHNVGMSAVYTFPNTSTVDPSTITGDSEERQLTGTWTTIEANAQTGTLQAGITETTLSYIGEPQTITTEGGELFLIPQTLTAWNRGTDASPVAPTSQTGSYLIIRCRLASNGLYLAGSPTTWGEVYVPYGGTFNQGQHYTVTLTFGLGYNEFGDKNQIQVSTTSTIIDWERETINFDRKIL